MSNFSFGPNTNVTAKIISIGDSNTINSRDSDTEKKDSIIRKYEEYCKENSIDCSSHIQELKIARNDKDKNKFDLVLISLIKSLPAFVQMGMKLYNQITGI